MSYFELDLFFIGGWAVIWDLKRIGKLGLKTNTNKSEVRNLTDHAASSIWLHNVEQFAYLIMDTVHFAHRNIELDGEVCGI